LPAINRISTMTSNSTSTESPIKRIFPFLMVKPLKDSRWAR
jgi:hypothetical protein